MRRPASTALLLSLALLAGASLASQKKTASRSPGQYKGREIAYTMHYAAARWLVRESREREEECSTLLRTLGVRPGDVVCDIGCGNGFYTLKLAELVGEKGKVLAVDIQPQMLTLLRQRARKAGVADRIVPVLGTVSDPKLAAGTVDLVLLVDVYHELSHPEAMLRAIRASLAPGGRIALVEFRTEDPKVPIKRLHKMSKRQMLKEIPPNGFRLVEQFDGLPWQHVMFFERAEDDPLASEVRAGLARATAFVRSIAVRGGFAGVYSLDLTKRYGEALYEKATQDEIWIQPPGTPSVGEVFLRAFRSTGDDRYFVAARDAGRALAWAQRRAGGWDHRAKLTHLTAASVRPARKPGPCTFDDDISQGALTFLISLDDVVEERWLTESIELGLDHLLASQFDNGAWPQWFPLRGGYHDFYTFNDAAINDCIRVALFAYERYEREDCKAAALRAGDFIILSQLGAEQAGWAQQYSHDLRPAPARAFEPAGVCSAVTARNLATLMQLYRFCRAGRFLAPIPAALKWLDRSKLADGVWARFYELGTNRPIYGDRDGEVHYALDEISVERQKGYSWRGTWGIPQRGSEYRALDRDKARRPAARDRAARVRRASSLRGRIRRVLTALDEQGRWVRDGRIYIADFVRNARMLCEYLEL